MLTFNSLGSSNLNQEQSFFENRGFLKVKINAYFTCESDNVPKTFANAYLFQRFARDYRSSHRRCSIKEGILKYFTKFTGRHLSQSLYLLKLQVQVCKNIFLRTLPSECFYDYL